MAMGRPNRETRRARLGRATLGHGEQRPKTPRTIAGVRARFTRDSRRFAVGRARREGEEEGVRVPRPRYGRTLWPEREARGVTAERAGVAVYCADWLRARQERLGEREIRALGAAVVSRVAQVGARELLRGGTEEARSAALRADRDRDRD